MISTLKWLPKGASQLVPDRYELAPEEIEMLENLPSAEENKEQEETLSIQQQVEKDEEVDMLDEDEAEEKEESDDDDDSTDETPRFSKSELADMDQKSFLEALNLDAYDNDEEKPINGMFRERYAEEIRDDQSDLSDLSDREDYELKGTDVLLVTGKTEDEHSCIEVHVYDAESGSLYVHHDFSLPSFPLAIEWLNLDPRSNDCSRDSQGSFVAIGSFDTGIEIWNLDVIDALEPVATLGGVDQKLISEDYEEEGADTNAKGKGKKKHKKHRFDKEGLPLLKGSHSDSVMCLSWSPLCRERLASGSADNAIKIWNIQTQKCEATLKHHSDKVQALAWNPAEPSILLSGSFDKSVCVTDVRNPAQTIRFQVDADVEVVEWNPHNPATFAVSTESGNVFVFDVRKPDAGPLLKFKAHDDACSGVSFNHLIPNLIATGSPDESVKLWDCSNLKATLVESKEMKIGEIFALKFSADEPLMLSAGGSEGVLALWEISESENIESRYACYLESIPNQAA